MRIMFSLGSLVHRRTLFPRRHARTFDRNLMLVRLTAVLLVEAILVRRGRLLRGCVRLTGDSRLFFLRSGGALGSRSAANFELPPLLIVRLVRFNLRLGRYLLLEHLHHRSQVALQPVSFKGEPADFDYIGENIVRSSRFGMRKLERICVAT